ncbi:MAG: helix-turn-helix transcriptional regulator [Porticoccaceae bacterium]|jgi:AraC family transcriptional regulator|nr:helix-turn-helix transcriptional regulator [Porticoccaceae bacterium]HLS97338.1 helix-turn-helix transcriptional regulator [Porticoccaceae bacterium]
MTTPESTSPAPSDDSDPGWQRKLDSSLPKTLSNGEYDIEGRIARPRASVEIRHFHPREPQVPNPVIMDVCYLSLALSPRPADMQVNYLGSNNPKYFTSLGNCCFVPAGQESYVRGSVGQYREICCLFDLSLFEPHIGWHWTPLELAACFDIRNLNIRTYLLRLAEEVMTPRYGQEALVDALIQALMVELSRHFRAVRDVSDKTSGQLSARHLRLIEERVISSGGSELSVEALAQLCDLSSRHLSRMFKRTTGRTLGQYINEIRINRAKLLLSQPDCLVKEVAFRCGFTNQSSFSQVFRKATGKTPKKFRSEIIA